MSKPIIEVEKLSKLYHLGTVGSTTLRESFNRWWHRVRGKKYSLQAMGQKQLMVDPSDPQAGPEPNTILALKDVSFTVNGGEIVGIIGSNGAGKSTLLKILAKITEPTSGRGAIRGRISSLLEVGTGFHPELTGRENIYLNGAILGMKKKEIDSKFEEIVAFSEIEKFIETPVKHYSSGMYVRLAFAVAAHLEPEILLVDEVLAVGDTAFQKKCLAKMGDVAKGGRTVLFVSHNMSAIANLTTRCIVLELGKVGFSGPPDQAIQRYVGVDRQVSVVRRMPITQLNYERRLQLHPGVSLKEVGLSKYQQSQIHVGGSLQIEVIIETNKEYEALRFGYSIRDGLNAFILTGFSPAFCVNKVGEHMFYFSINNLFLAPGTYDLSMSIGSGNESEPKFDYDMVVGFLRFAVDEFFNDSKPLDNWNSSSWGRIVHLDSTVRGGVL